MSPELREHIEAMEVQILMLKSGKKIMGLVEDEDEQGIFLAYPIRLEAERSSSGITYLMIDDYVPIMNDETVLIYGDSFEGMTYAGFMLKLQYHQFLLTNKIKLVMAEDRDDDEEYDEEYLESTYGKEVADTKPGASPLKNPEKDVKFWNAIIDNLSKDIDPPKK